MPVHRSTAALAAATLFALTACDDGAAEPLPLDGDAVLEGGTLRVRGDSESNHIRVGYASGGIDVERDGETASFPGPVQRIEITAAEGNDEVRFEQTSVGDVALMIDSGEGDDVVQLVFEPGGAGSEMTVSSTVDSGPGSDQVDFRWSGLMQPALNAYVGLETESQSFLPEQDDEVLVTFESGDPDRPVVIGAVYNGQAPATPGPEGDSRSFGLELDFLAGKADFAVAVVGGAGPDQLEVNADYSGVTLQQGRVTMDADLAEGDNSVDQYIVTSVLRTDVDTNVAARDGANFVDLETVLGGDGALTYAVDLGDGDNETSITFGDGARGSRPTSGTRSVVGSYRSGSGTNALALGSNIVEPLASDFSVDFGTGQNSALGRYMLELPWTPSAAPGAQVAPSQVKVVLLAAEPSALDLQVEVGDPERDPPAALGVVTAKGSALNETDFDFVHRLVAGSGGTELEQEWELSAGGLVTSGDASVVVDIPPELERLVYVQELAEVAGGATLTVALHGDTDADAVLAHLLGVSGAGDFDLTVDGGAGNDLLAALTRDLVTDGGGMTFALSGGSEDDVLGLVRPTDVAVGAPIVHAIAAGAGTDACFASQDVQSTECERLEAVGDELLRLLEAEFGAALADLWRE